MQEFHRARSALLVAILGGGILAGCSEDKKLIPPDPHPDVEYSTPAKTLETYRSSYESRDSVKMKVLYDSTYVGESIDLSEPPGTLPWTFRRADEIAHVAALARNSSISVLCYLGNPNGWTRLPSNDPVHPEWALIQLATSQIHIIDASTATVYSTGSYDFMEFAFSPTTPASTSPTDTLWKIVRWREIRAGP